MGATATATATEMQNHFGRYLALVKGGGEVIVTKNGKEVGRLIPRDATVSYLTDSLTGILKGDTNIDQAREERLRKKYEAAD
ncbi:MAG: type II toxin-antitoxin system prevent-host-death family antitoxin [Lachnospiraceae bacterium]|nr:type II toxin-antitoxin system prevent-host-death family antitoxin [Lachnospiraceae bacterium]